MTILRITDIEHNHPHPHPHHHQHHHQEKTVAAKYYREKYKNIRLFFLFRFFWLYTE